MAERCAAPAVQKRIAGALALLDHDDPGRREMELTMRKPAKPHDANTLSRLRPVPGLGEILRLVLLYAIHDIQRFPRVPDFVSYCRLGTGATAAAGKRYGTSGTTSGKASLQGAFAEAAVLCVRANPRGQPYLTRLETKHSKGKACTILAHT